MPIPSPFHSRTSQANESHEWRNWAGYLAASLYEPVHEREYYAIRNSAALIDVSPLYKYEVSGADALRLLNRIMTRDISKCAVGQVMYSPWCDDAGLVIDDGTLARLAPDRFRVTAAEPNLAWFQDCGYGMDAQVLDVTAELAALALQGPSSRKLLKALGVGVDAGKEHLLDNLKYYRVAPGRIGNIPISLSRTGYTGDLGYELWVEAEHALPLWDALIGAGENYGLTPAGILALDIARIEAGLIMLGVDYISSRFALIPEQKSSPFELGLEWAVDLEKADFVGRKALLAGQKAGWQWLLAGVEVDWPALEALYARWDLAPPVAGRASRHAVPIYKDSRQVGQMTSHTFSPILKKYIGIATVERRYAGIGDAVTVEATVEYTRQHAPARLARLPFFNPARKRA